MMKPFRQSLPVGNARFHDPLYLTSIGCEDIGVAERYPHADAPLFFFDWDEGRILPESCLVLVTGGQGELHSDKGRVRLGAGDVFLVQPGEWHRHRPLPETGWSIWWIHYHGDDSARWSREGLYKLSGNLVEVADRGLFQAQFERLLKSLHDDVKSVSHNIIMQTYGLLSHILLDSHADEVNTTGLTKDGVVNEAIDYIWGYGHWALTVPDVARHLGIARRTLDRRFSKARGRSVLEEILNCKLTRSARLLRETDMQIKEIVHRAGFSSDEQFRVAFHRAYGSSPGAYRKSCGEQQESG